MSLLDRFNKWQLRVLYAVLTFDAVMTIVVIVQAIHFYRKHLQ